MTVHVDDTKLFGPNIEDIEWCKFEISKQFDIKDVTESKRYLGMKIDQNDEGITLSQEQFVLVLLKQFKMEDFQHYR
jgi:hypothetical protein